MNSPGKLPLRNRLAFRQAKLVLAVGLVVGILLSCFQLRNELQTMRKRMEHETALLTKIIQGPAAQAVYNFDTSQARELIAALLLYEEIDSASIHNEFGETLAESSSPQELRYPDWLKDLTFGPDRAYGIKLEYGPQHAVVGELDITLNSNRLLQEFLSFSGTLVLTEVARNIILAFLLGTIIYYVFMRNMLKSVYKISSVDIDKESPKKIRIPKVHDKDEFGVMIETINSVFNSLNNNIYQRKILEGELRELNRKLEARIRDRTDQLETQTKKLEKEIEERRLAEESLAQQHAFLNRIFEEIGAGIIVFDTSRGAITESNKVAQDLFGLEPDEARSHAAGKDGGIEFRADNNVYDILSPATDDERTFQEGVAKLADGKVIPLARHLVRMELFGVPLLVQIFFDITEIKNLERQLSISQRMESIGLLAAGIAHEINTPIQYVGDSVTFIKRSFEQVETMLGRYEDLLRAIREGKEAAGLVRDIEAFSQEADLPFIRSEIPQACDMALDGSQRVTKIVLAMKKFSHVGSEEEMKAFDVNDALQNTIAVAKNEWKYVSTVATDFDTELPLVTCIPGDINQVFLNIVINAAHAIKETVEGTGELGAIAIKTQKGTNHAHVFIQDTGCGIPPGNMDKIFVPFFTTKEVGQGTGQGLAIAHDIVVNKHGGTISVKSEPGAGTTFHIRIPYFPSKKQ